MESLAMDMGQMNVGATPSSSRTLLEVLGYDQDTSFDRPITTQIVSDTNHLSIGGRSGITGGENIQIMVRDDNIVMDIGRSGLAFELRLPNQCYVDNVLSLLQPIEWILGNTQCGYANMQYFLQQRLAHNKPKHYNKLMKHMLLGSNTAVGVSSSGFAFPGAYAGVDFTRQAGGDFDATGLLQPGGLVKLNALQGYARTAVQQSLDGATIGGHIQSKIQMQKIQRVATSADSTGNYANDMAGAFDVYRCFIPLNEIFPQLKEIPDGLIYVGLGQQLKLNIRLNNADDCILLRTSQARSYFINRPQLVKVYTKLDAPRADAILRSSLILPKKSYSAYTTAVSNSPILVFNVTQKDRVKGLYIGFHYKGAVTNTKIAGFTAQDLYSANADANTGNGVKNRISTMIGVPIEYLHFNFGGETRVFTLNQLDVLGIIRFGDFQETLYQTPGAQALHDVLYIDMERFCHDVFGSSNQSAMNIQVQLQLKQNLQQSGFGTPHGEIAPIVDFPAGIENFQIYAFLETQQLMALEGGMYKNV